MKLLKRNLKGKSTIKIESLDDMWNLMHIIRTGDLIGAKTIRTLQTSNEKEKRPVYLILNTEKVDFSEEAEMLRISGKIIEGPEDISHGYHTFSLAKNSIFDIKKDWKKYELDRLEKSLRSTDINILTALVDEHSANFYHIKESKISNLGEMDGSGSCKIYRDTDNNQFYSKVIKAIEEYAKRYDHIIIAGPGFTKDNILKLIKDETVRKKIITEGCSTTSISGVNEVIKRGAIDRIIKDTFLSKETEAVNAFLEELSKNSGLAIYGKEDTKNAAAAGAIKIFLVSEKMVRDQEVQNIIDSAQKSGAEIHIIGYGHDAGKQLYNLTGLAAITKYKLR